MRFGLVALLFSASLCSLVSILPIGITSESVQSTICGISDIGAYTTFYTPAESCDKILESDTVFNSLFTKKQKSFVVALTSTKSDEITAFETRKRMVVEDKYKQSVTVTPAVRFESFSNLNKAKASFISYDATLAQGSSAQVITEKEGAFGAVTKETVESYYPSTDGKVVIETQTFDLTVNEDLQFLYELAYIRAIAEKKFDVADFTTFLFSSQNKFTEEKRKVALKEIITQIDNLLLVVEPEHSTQIALLGDYGRIEEESANNYTGIAWITIASVFFILSAALLGSYLMVSVGDDCAKDTLLARAY